MFGQQKPAFGQPTTGAGFGFATTTAAASPFAQSTFGKPATSGFGQAPAFGQQNSLLFSGNQTTATGPFGAGTSGFGTTATTQPAFGGFSQAQPNTSIFGATQQNANTGTLFAQPSTSAFGATKPSGFGFGQTQPSMLMFGQSTTANTSAGFRGFGQNTSVGGMFGSTTNAGFGQSVATTTTPGTSIAKYQPTLGTDTLTKNGQSSNVNTKLHCATAMKEYENKSLEELRLEDYASNRKGPQAAGGLFGQNQPAAGGIFGAQTTQQQTTSIFGQPAENKSIFGTNTNTLGGGGFGQPAAAGFGATNPTQQAGLFGKPFGNTATTGSGFGFGSNSLFGQTTQSTAPTFGQQTMGFTNTAGGFSGANTNQPTSLFGNPTTDNKPAFGLNTTTTNTGFGAFGTTNTSTAGASLFGNKPATGFGANTGFGTNTATTTGFGNFGNTNTAGSFFNNTLNKPTSLPFSGFGTQTSTAPAFSFIGGNQSSLLGNTANKPGGLFGNTGAAGGTGLLGSGSTFGNNSFGGFGTNNQAANSLFGGQQQPASLIHQQIMSLAPTPYGDNPIFKDIKAGGDNKNDTLKPTNPAAQKAILESTSNQFKVSPKITGGLKVKPVGNALTKKSLFDGLEEYDSSVQMSFSLKPNAKRLIIKPKSNRSPITQMSAQNSPLHQQHNHLVENGSESFNRNSSILNDSENSFPAQINGEQSTHEESWLRLKQLEKTRDHNRSSEILENSIAEGGTEKNGLLKSGENGSNGHLVSANTSDNTSSMSKSGFLDSTSKDMLSRTTVFDNAESDAEPHPTGIVLRRAGYYTIPSLDDLINYLSEDGQKCIVPNFTIGRTGYGNVYFDGPLDVYGLNLDKIIHFRHKEVILYPDDDDKPPVGQELNRKAQVTLDQVWPLSKMKNESNKGTDCLIDYESKLRRVAAKHGTRFVDYRPETGSWVFKVDHFSKYGLSDSDEEDIITPEHAKSAAGTLIAPVGINQKTLTSKMALNELKGITGTDARRSEPGGGGGDIDDDGTEIMTGDPTEMADLEAIDRHFLLRDDELRGELAGISSQLDDDGPHKMMAMSPTTALAVGMRTDSHKLQLMKASLFNDDDIMDGKSVISDRLDGQDTPDQLVPNEPSLRNFGSYSSIQTLLGRGAPSGSSILDEPYTPTPYHQFRTIEESPSEKEYETESVRQVAVTKQPPLVIKPKVAKIKLNSMHVPLEESIYNALQGKCLTDSALFQNRRFKIGFGPRNNVVQLRKFAPEPTDPMQASLLTFFNGRFKLDTSSVVVENVKISSLADMQTIEPFCIEHLRIQLNYSTHVEISDSGCPHLLPRGGTELLQQHFHEASKLDHKGEPFAKYIISVWSLCQALWGDQEELEDQDPLSHLAVMCRRELFSQWLEKTINDTADVENDEKRTADNYLSSVLDYVMCHKVVDACELSFKNGDANMAMLLAQLSSGPTVRQLIQHQLSLWQDVSADEYIDIAHLKMLMLVAGVPLLSSSHGPINIFENVNWIKALALQLWYLSSPTSSVTDALIAYEEAFNAENYKASGPKPPHSREYETNIVTTRTSVEAETTEPTRDEPQDLRFHILKLFSKRSHPLEQLLNPITHTADVMDFRLSWLLLQTFQALGYHHCSELCENLIHVSFASQLENYDLWHWSIFVLLHIKNQHKRELCIQEVLYRYIDLSEEPDYLEKEKFVKEELGIPEKWINWAKAVKAGAVRNYHKQAKYLLKASQWPLAHEVIMQQIAPDAIINDNSSYLHSLLKEFEDPRLVPNWLNQGQIFLDFIEMNLKLEDLKTARERDIETKFEGLKPHIVDLCSRIKLLPCPTSKHRLCQSEIAKKLSLLIRNIAITCEGTLSDLIKGALDKLPLPEEYMLQEVMHFFDTFIAEM